MPKKRNSGALQWITREAKRLRRKYPKRFATWREYVAQASAIYASKHKGRSPVGKKRRRVRGVKTVSKSHVDKNRIVNNFQIGSVASLQAALRKKFSERLKDHLYLRDRATTKKAKRRHSREIARIKKRLRNL